MGTPKALVELEGRPLLEHLLAPRLLRQFADVVVVLGHHAEPLRPIVNAHGYRYTMNLDPDRGRMSSVQTGLRALGTGVRAAFLQPVDCPLVLPATYQALASALGTAEVAIPVHEGKHGHPPLFSTALVPRIMDAGPDQPLCEILQAPDVHRVFVEVDDQGILLNVNEPRDLEQLKDICARRARTLVDGE